MRGTNMKIIMTLFTVFSGCNGSHIPCNEPEPSTASFDACVHLGACTAAVEEVTTQIIYRSIMWSAWQLDMCVCVFVCVCMCVCVWKRLWRGVQESVMTAIIWVLEDTCVMVCSLTSTHSFKVIYSTGLFFFSFLAVRKPTIKCGDYSHSGRGVTKLAFI